MANTLAQDLRKLGKLRRQYDADTQRAKESERVFKEFQERCFERMEAEDVQSPTVAGTRFTRVETTYGTVQDREAFLEWAANEDESLLERRERKALTNQLVRERLDNGEELPPGLGFYTRRYISQSSS